MYYRHLHKFSHKVLTPEIFLYYSAQFLDQKKKKKKKKKQFRAVWGLFNDAFASCMVAHGGGWEHAIQVPSQTLVY